MSSVRNIRYKYRRQFLPTAAVSMKQNHNTIDAIDINVPILDHSWPSHHQSLKKKTDWPLSRGYFGSWGHALVAVAVVERFK